MEGDQLNQLSGVKEIADENKNYSIEQLLDTCGTCLDTLIHLSCYLVMQIHHDGALVGQGSSRVKHAWWCAGVVVLSGLI